MACPRMKVNTSAHWILVVVRYRIILSDYTALQICSQLLFFNTLVRSTKLSSRRSWFSEISSSLGVSFPTIASRWIYLTALLLTVMKRSTWRNVTWTLPGGRSVGLLLSCVSAPGTRRFPGLNLPSFYSLKNKR